MLAMISKTLSGSEMCSCCFKAASSASNRCSIFWRIVMLFLSWLILVQSDWTNTTRIHERVLIFCWLDVLWCLSFLTSDHCGPNGAVLALVCSYAQVKDRVFLLVNKGFAVKYAWKNYTKSAWIFPLGNCWYPSRQHGCIRVQRLNLW